MVGETMDSLIKEIVEQVKTEVVEKIGNANAEQIKEIVLELRMDMTSIIDERVKINLANMMNRMSEELKKSIRR